MSTIWQWIHNKQQDAILQQDDARLELMRTFWQMLDSMENNPEMALSYAHQARLLAEMLHEKWFIQLINHWELQTRFAFLGDFTGTLELASRATVEVRLPEYQDFPQRICLHEDLISAYVQQDPIGNRDLIQQALDYMEKEVSPSVECFICLNSLKLNFTRTTQSPLTTIEQAIRSLQIAQESEHHLSFMYIVLVESAYETEQWDKLLTWAIEAESNARASQRENYIATALIWLAFHARRIQDDVRALSLYQQAHHRANRYMAFMGKPYYTALTAFHELGGELEEALHTQQTYREMVTGRAKPFAESQALLEIIRLKKLLGQAVDEDIQALHTVVKDLKAPDYILNQLA